MNFIIFDVMTSRLKSILPGLSDKAIRRVFAVIMQDTEPDRVVFPRAGWRVPRAG